MKKNLYLFYIIVVSTIIIYVLIFSSCDLSHNLPVALAGIWEYVEKDGEREFTYRIEIKSDNSMTINEIYGNVGSCKLESREGEIANINNSVKTFSFMWRTSPSSNIFYSDHFSYIISSDEKELTLTCDNVFFNDYNEITLKKSNRILENIISKYLNINNSQKIGIENGLLGIWERKPEYFHGFVYPYRTYRIEIKSDETIIESEENFSIATYLNMKSGRIIQTDLSAKTFTVKFVYDNHNLSYDYSLSADKKKLTLTTNETYWDGEYIVESISYTFKKK